MKQILISGLLILSITLYGQKASFTVLAVKGNCWMYTTSAAKSSPVKAGGKLTSAHVLKLGDGAYLGLMSANGKSMELNGAGIYKVNELEKKAASSSGSMKKFANYVIGEVVSGKGPSKEMKHLGAVERRTGAQLFPAIPAETAMLRKPVTFSWLGKSGINKYTLTITDEKSKTIFTQDVEDVNCTVDLGLSAFSKGKVFNWAVTAFQNPSIASDAATFIFLTQAREDEVMRTMKEFTAGSMTAFDHLTAAKFLEDKKLYYTAMKQYQAAASLQPGVAYFQDSYKQFLLSVNLNRVAETLP